MTKEEEYVLYVEREEEMWQAHFKDLWEQTKEIYKEGLLGSNCYEDELSRLYEEEEAEIEALYLRAMDRGVDRNLLATAIRKNNPGCKDALGYLEDIWQKREWDNAP